MAYYLADDARTRARRSDPRAYPRPAPGTRVVPRRAGGEVPDERVDAEPDGDRATAYRDRPARLDRARPGHQPRPTRRAGRRRGRGHPAPARSRPRRDDLD